MMEGSKLCGKVIDVLQLFIHIIHAYLEAFYRVFVPPPLRSLTGEIVLVTGSAKGIGAALCRRLAILKTTVIMWDCDSEENDALATELRSQGARVHPYNLDISDINQVALTAAKVREEVGDVTIVINNAGIAPLSEFLKTSPEALEKTFQVNVLAHFWILKEFLPRMIDTHHGHIVSLCSIGGIRPMGGSVPYFSSKFAVRGYVESLKLQLALLDCPGIRFTTAYPSFVETGLIKDVKYADKNATWMNSLIPFLQPDEVAASIIEGVQRGYEHVYCPWILPYLVKLECLLPLKLRKEVQMKLDRVLSHPELMYQKSGQ